MLPPTLDSYTEKHLRDWLGQRELDKARAYVEVVQDMEITPEFIRAVVPGTARKPYLAVSYTHLDVYKRQGTEYGEGGTMAQRHLCECCGTIQSGRCHDLLG